MMWPLRCSIMCGRAAAIPYNVPLRFTSMLRSQSSTLRRSSGECGMTRALLRITSIRLHGVIDEADDLLVPGHVGLHDGPVAERQLGGQRLQPIEAPRTQHHLRTF